MTTAFYREARIASAPFSGPNDRPSAFSLVPRLGSAGTTAIVG